MRPFARALSVVVCFALLLTVSHARPGLGHRRRHHNHGHQPRHTESHSRVVFDGIAATSFVESHEPEEPAPTTYYPTQTATTTTGDTGTSTTTTTVTTKTKTSTIAPETCENVACQSHSDCTYNGCGGYFCVTCPACDGEDEMGVCMWNPSPEDLDCPALNCPHSIHDNAINVIDTPPQTLNITQLDPPSYYPQNDTQTEEFAEPPQEETVPPQGQPVQTAQSASPWDSSFSNLKEESQNNTEAAYVDETEGLYNGTESSEDDLG